MNSAIVGGTEVVSGHNLPAIERHCELVGCYGLGIGEKFLRRTRVPLRPRRRRQAGGKRFGHRGDRHLAVAAQDDGLAHRPLIDCRPGRRRRTSGCRKPERWRRSRRRRVQLARSYYFMALARLPITRRTRLSNNSALSRERVRQFECQALRKPERADRVQARW